jgi:hypothetical protein
MKTDLVRPCSKCPFRSDIPGYLTEGRAEEIASALLSDASFSCHETNRYDEAGEDLVETADSQHCAGAMIWMEKQGRANQWMRWMERSGFYDARKLDMESPVFEDAEDFIAHHAESESGRRRVRRNRRRKACNTC